MEYRVARPTDIDEIQRVRNLVKENTLSDPSIICNQMVFDFMFNRGKGWVCIINQSIAGFAIADLVEDNIWALFIDPKYEGMGIGKNLQKIMLNWYFEQGKEQVCLNTDKGTRAEGFYRYTGWLAEEVEEKKELKFCMTKLRWQANLNK